jgi:hypothetical protein
LACSSRQKGKEAFKEWFQIVFHKKSCAAHGSSIWDGWNQFNCLSFLPALLIHLPKWFARKVRART